MKWIKKIVVGIVCIFVCGASYQFISTKLDEHRYPPLGQMVDVGGYKLHMYSTGSGGPAVILESGLGCPTPDWGLVQPEIAKFTQVVSYDRAGLGWSEASPLSRTSEHIVQELHTLLQNANIPKPYILVGHSFGGNNVQLYAATYPDEVLGIVLVDSCHEEQESRLPPNPFQERLKLLQNPSMVRFMSTFGISRFRSQVLKKRMPLLPDSMEKAHLALIATTKHRCTISAEIRNLPESLKQLENTNRSSLKNKPCIVLSAGREPDLTKFAISEEEQNAIHKMQLVWNELQNDLASKFENSHHFIAEKSDHFIPFHQPELVIDAVRGLINPKINEDL